MSNNGHNSVSVHTCPDGFEVIGSGCYYFYNDFRVSWDAGSVCEQLGGWLATAKSVQLLQELRSRYEAAAVDYPNLREYTVRL